MDRFDITAMLPVGVPTLHILLALGHMRLHGYGIMQAIEEKTAGTARILPGTLYTTLNRMQANGLVEETRPPDVSDDDPRRRYYRTTEFGHAVVAAETERMAVLLELARRNTEVS